MKITHVIQHLGLGGAESFVVELANQQQTNGHSVDVLMVGTSRHLREELQVPFTVIDRRNGPDIRAIRQVRRHLTDRGVEVVHAHTAPGLIYGGLGAIWARTPAKIFTEHSSSSPGDQYGRKTRILNYMASTFDAVVTFDEELGRQLRSKPELRRARVEVIPNGVTVSDHRVFQHDESREALGVPRESLVVLSVGGLRPQKNYGLLIEVARRVGCVDVDGISREVKFFIIGEGSERAHLESLIAESEIPNVRLFGGYPNARRLFRGADLLLNTSTWEGMPITMLEAMAEKLAIVATRTGSVETVLGPNGTFVSDDPSEIADTVSQLLADHKARDAAVDDGYGRIGEYFSIERVARKYEELYTSALTGVTKRERP